MDRPSPVPAAPNESLIRGRILKAESAPGNGGFIWTVAVEGCEAVPGQLDLASKQVGKTVRLFVPACVKERPGEGACIEARATFQGDEHGAAFYLVGSDVCELPKPKPKRKSNRTKGQKG